MDEDSQSVELSVASVLELLSQGELTPQGSLPYSSNYTILCSVEHNNLQGLAVYKPRRGERPLWDFPRGTLCRREVAAYVVSEALDFSLIPPTVLRNGPHGLGSVQLYIDSDQEAHLFTMQKEGGFEEQIRKLALLDCLINNADRKSGHCLKGADGRLWAIDHGICFHTEYKLRTVLWDYVGDPIEDDALDALRSFHQSFQQHDAVAEMLGELLEKDELRALRRRLDRLINSGVYPSPGHGPNIPWPPV